MIRTMRGWRWVATIGFAWFASTAVGFVPAARAEGSSKDTSGAKSSENGKNAAAKPKKQRKPAREGDRDDKGEIYRE